MHCLSLDPGIKTDYEKLNRVAGAIRNKGFANSFDSISVDRDDLCSEIQYISDRLDNSYGPLKHPYVNSIRVDLGNNCFNQCESILFVKPIVHTERFNFNVNGHAVSAEPLFEAYVIVDSDIVRSLFLIFGWNEPNGSRGTACQGWFKAEGEESPLEVRLEISQNIKLMLIVIQNTFANKPECLSLVSTARRSAPAKPGKKKKNKRNRTTVIKRYAMSFGHTSGGSGRQITCPCWGVSGHWRHYKSGKTVWISPYKKGRERSDDMKYQPKEYVAVKLGGTK